MTALALTQLFGYPFLIWLVWIWFGIAERNAGDLLASLLLGIVILTIFSWLLASLLYGTMSVGRRLSKALLFTLAVVVLLGCVAWLLGYAPRATDWIAVRISNGRGSAINPRRAAWVYPAFLWFVALSAIATLLPTLFFSSSRTVRDIRYWAIWLALILIGFGMPSLLLNWIPEMSSLKMQTVSLAVRFLLAWLIAVGSLMAFARLLRSLAAGPSGSTSESPHAHTSPGVV